MEPSTRPKSIQDKESPIGVQDLEVKDAQIIFNTVWAKLESEYGRENLHFPEEIFWLNGAPGAGKGTHTRFIMEYRNFTGSPIIVSNLLKSPSAQRRIDAGILVGDREVIEIVFNKLLEPEYQSGAIVDGFPRTPVQVECLKLLHHKISEVHAEFFDKSLNGRYKKPAFHIIVLFIDEEESIARQLLRGKQVLTHNQEVEQSGMGKLTEVRKTDVDQSAALNRYRIFKEQTYESLKSLREVFHFHYINAHGSVEEVRERIIGELKYQSSLELNQKTFNRLTPIPIASTIAVHARQDLVGRLDSYEENHADLFKQVVELIDQKFIPIIKCHAIPGRAIVRSENPVFEDPLALAMVVDVFSERGYYTTVEVRIEEIPLSIDRETFEIKTKSKRVYRFKIHFNRSEIRRGR